MNVVELARRSIREPRSVRRAVRHRLRMASYNLGLRLGGALDGYPLPPARLVNLVIGTRELAWYQLGGLFMSQSISTILRRNGTSIESFKSILDFGCGCGRIIRWLSALRSIAEIWGCDYNPTLVEWCQRNLSRVARFGVNGADPPLPFEGEKFDFVYSYSVFTHLSARRQKPWMRELVRVLRPGGLLLVTVHGRRVAWRSRLSSEQLRQLEDEGLLVLEQEKSGTNYCAAYHSQGYMSKQEAIGLELVEYMEGGANDASEQDVYLYRKLRGTA
jgi:SAM-dependent methyltransferase